MPNRRSFIRWQINRQAKVKLEGAEAFANCQIKDINLKGLQIALGLKLQKDTFLKLRVVLTEEFTLNIEVWIAWHKTIDGHNVYGLYFTKISDLDKEKIYQFTRRYYGEQIAKQWWKDLGEEKGGEVVEEIKFEDRRTFERFPAQLALRFLDLNSNHEGLAETCDISAKGMGFVASEELVPQTPLEVWLEIPDKGESLYTRGEVVWSKRVEPNKYRIGVNLERADLMGVARVLRAV